jgi:ribosome maturation factor RimP
MAGRIRKLAEPLCEIEGIELVHAEAQQGPDGSVIRVYIDRPQGGGVTIEDCVHISRKLSEAMDVYISGPDMENIGPYNLEVSSPGPNRPLGKKSDFKKFKGQRVEIKTEKFIDGQKRFKGVLSGISEENVNLLINSRNIDIPFQEIIRARLIK